MRVSFDILDPYPAALPQAVARPFDAAQKARVIFELVVEPVILGPEADKQSGRFPVAGDDDLLVFGFAQKPREVVPGFDSGTRLTQDLRIALAIPRPLIGHDRQYFDR